MSLQLITVLSIILASRSSGVLIQTGNHIQKVKTLSYLEKKMFILGDPAMKLVTGKLVEFNITTTESVGTVWLQVWRPFNSTGYSLVAQVTYISEKSGNIRVTVPPQKEIHVQNGDRLGFFQEVHDGILGYVWAPDEPGANTVSADITKGAPIIGKYYSFITRWKFFKFAISAIVETDGSRSPTTPAPTVSSIGNDILPGKTINNTKGAIVLKDKMLVTGVIARVMAYPTSVNRTIVFQVWRPNTNNTFTLIAERDLHPTRQANYTFQLERVVFVQNGDRLGFTNLQNQSCVTAVDAPHNKSSKVTLYVFGRQRPIVNNTYVFTENTKLKKYIFSISVEVEDLWKYIRPKPISLHEDKDNNLFWLLIIPSIMALVAVIATITGLCHVLEKQREFYVHEYDNPNILPTDRDWDFPREKVRMYDILSESHEGFLIKAEAEDIIPGNPGITLVAVKTLKATASDMQKYMMMRELELMKSLPPHPNVLQLLGVCIEKDPILMIVETCGLGNLQDYLTYVKDRNLHLNIAGHNNFTLTKEILTFGSQIAKGMHYLASFSVLHRDLAARNIYIGEGRICKVSHFGFARDVIENYQYERTAQARLPVRWMAPESLLNNVYTVKSNVWSFGVLLWEMASLGATPYPNQTVSQVTRSIKRGQKLECPPHCGDELYTIMKLCWKQKPYERPDFETLRKDLEDLADNSKEYIQLEKYPENVYVRLAKTEDEIV